MKTTIRLVIATLFISTISSISVAQASTWRMSEDAVTLGMNGASAHVERINGVDRVWRADGAQMARRELSQVIAMMLECVHQ